MRPLPDLAVRRPVRSGALRELGVGRRELAGPLWRRLGHGVSGWSALDRHDPLVRAHAAAAGQPPGTVLGGWAALHVQGVAVLDGRTGAGGEVLQPVLVHVGERGRTRPSPLLDVDRGRLDPADVIELSGLLVMSATAACVSIACRYGAEEGLVAADAAAALNLTSQAALQSYVAAHRGCRGIPRARLMADLVDSRSASPPETRLRYVWVVEAGLPVPLVNATVVDRYGCVVGKPDLLDLEAAAVTEYDGSQHRALRHHTADNAREEAFERLNLGVARATSLDLWPARSRLVARLRDVRSRGMDRDVSRDRWGWRL
jgi:hypothetical protein